MENLTYETKCRKCGNVTEYAFLNHDNPTRDEHNRFAQLMNIYLRTPPSFECLYCNKPMVQDLVSYSRPEFTKEDFELTQSQKGLIEKCNE